MKLTAQLRGFENVARVKQGIVTVADVYTCVEPGDQQEMARLFAAAPDLLQALRRLVDQTEDFDDTLNRAGSRHAAILAQARAAIAKAEGKA
jgi:hypothetical protein